MDDDLPPIPNTATQYLIGRDDMSRFFYRREADARALAMLQAGDEPGSTVYVYEVRLIHTVRIKE